MIHLQNILFNFQESYKQSNKLKLIRFSLTNFKNYEHQIIECDSKWNCFVGNNGMGKTNLLEAIYYLAVGKSYLGLSDQYLVKRNNTFFRLDSLFEIDEKKVRIVAKIIPRTKKELERDSVPYSRISDHLGLIPIVFIAPDDTYLIKEGSEVRRKFLDNTISQIDKVYLKSLINYNKTLKQRNALLKQFGANNTFNTTLLHTYNEQMLAPAQYIHKQRKAFLTHFKPLLSYFVQVLSEEKETVDCIYQSQMEQQTLQSLLLENQEKDRILQRTTVGIHKDDLSFKLEELALKRFGSQGQLKTFVLALKLAQYELLKQQSGQMPILLLDDIFDKLDQNRVASLLGILRQDTFGQVFISDTHSNRISQILEDFGATYRKYQINSGQAEPVNI